MPNFFRKIPRPLELKINLLQGKEFIVAAIVRLSKKDIISRKYKNFGITYKNGELLIERNFLPVSKGKFSRINSKGEIVIRKDLPKILKTFSFDAPNYGDWYNGSHEVSWEKDVYQRETIKGPKITIIPQLIEELEDEVVLAFKIEGNPKVSDVDFSKNLLFRLNLLQEIFGTCDLYGLDEKLQEKKAYKKLTWQILPSGWWRDNNEVSKIASVIGKRFASLFIERLKKIENLDPLESYFSDSYLGNRLYYVYVFKNVVIAECPMFGNALYFLQGDIKDSWQEIFSVTKREALNRGAKRLMHKGEWEKKLRLII